MVEFNERELLERLRSAKKPITGRQLKRLRSAAVGAVDPPIRKSLSGKSGEYSFYNDHHFRQACAAFDAAQENRRSVDRVFSAWYGEGIAPAKGARTTLRCAISSLQEIFKKAETRLGFDKIRSIESTADEQKMEAVYHVAEQLIDAKRPLKSVSGFRRNIAKATEIAGIQTAIESLHDLISDALTGVLELAFIGTARVLQYKAISDRELSPGVLLATALGLAPAMNKESPTRWIDGGPKAFIQTMIELVRAGDFQITKYPEYLDELSDEALEEGRSLAKAFTENLPTLIEGANLLHGKNALGLDMACHFLANFDVPRKAMLVIACARMARRDPQKTQQVLGALTDNINEAKALIAIAKAFPEYRELLRMDRYQNLGALDKQTRQKMLVVAREHLSIPSVGSEPGGHEANPVEDVSKE